MSTSEISEIDMQSMYDRICATVNKPFYDTHTPIVAEVFGWDSIAIKNDLNWYSIQQLQEEFEYVQFLRGMITVSDE